MDAYHRVLVKLYEITGGRETVDVDFAELLKKEGFFPSIEDIKSHLSREGWMTETSTPNVVRLTHWGVSAAKKAGSQRPDNDRALERDVNNLLSEIRGLGVVVEEFRANPSSASFKPVEDRLSSVKDITAKVKGLL